MRNESKATDLESPSGVKQGTQIFRHPVPRYPVLAVEALQLPDRYEAGAAYEMSEGRRRRRWPEEGEPGLAAA